MNFVQEQLNTSKNKKLACLKFPNATSCYCLRRQLPLYIPQKLAMENTSNLQKAT